MKTRILERYKKEPQDFLESIGAYGLRYGTREASGCCPMHSERKPSFSINLETGYWQCFSSCGGGDLFSLYKKIQSFDGSFYEQLQEMSKL